MDNAAIFTNLIVSRRRAPCAARRLGAFGLAAAFYLGLAAALLMSQLLIVESIDPPRADFDRIPVFHQTLLPASADRAAGSPGQPRRGGGDRGPDAAAHSPAPSLRPPAPRPVVVPILPPASEAAAAAAVDHGSLYQDGGLGPGGGEDSGPGGGGGTGCEGCLGDANGDGPGAGRGGAFDEQDPRITPPMIIPSSRRLPRYPDMARRAGVEGTVVLLIGIESDGRVGAVEVLRSPDPRYGFDISAIEAVKQWRYWPALLGGRPVAVQASVMVEFTISR